jgi:amino acid adenylation domain-containing protein
VLRTDLSADPTVGELLSRVRTAALGAYTHQDLPFEQLVDELAVDRDRSRTPLIQTLFNYFTEDDPEARERRKAASNTEQDWDNRGRIQDNVQVKVDLRVVVAEAGDGLTGTIEYSTALFDRATVERLAGHLVTMLDAFAGEPGQRLSELTLLSAAEQQQFGSWNDTRAALPSVSGVHELVPVDSDAVAVVGPDSALTYTQLDQRANRLAHHLINLGVRTETVVALCLDDGIDTITAMLAIWKAGAAYLPLDAGFPTERLSYMLHDSRTAVLITSHTTRDDLPAGRTPTLLINDPVLTAHPATSPTVSVDPDQCAYVIYTSGSTGQPKGVQVTHRGLINYATAIPERIGRRNSYLLLQTAVTDFANTTILTALTTGATLHLPDPDTATDPDKIRAYLDQHPIDTLKIVPSHLTALIRETDRPEDLLPRHTLILGGEATPPGLITRLEQIASGVRILNHYGPTETTIGATTHPITEPGTPPIGTPIANTRTYVLDTHLNPVPTAVTGELYIAGAGLARGYHNRPALTAERFIPDPFADDGTRLYRTGDRARQRDDGTIDFLGRVDHQVKIRGHRIETTEIQAALNTHPGINTAVVVTTGGDDPRLVAYLMPANLNAGLPTTDELRGHLARTLPDHMIPATYIELAALPLTANGKLNRTALPAPDNSRPDLTGRFVAPATPTEEVLAEIWSELLGIEAIGTTDNFFDLGGHSLLATQAVSRIRTTFQTDIPLGTLFDQPTVRQIAGQIEAKILAEIEQMPEDEILQSLDRSLPEKNSDEDGVSR